MVPQVVLWDAAYVSTDEQSALSAFLAEAVDALPQARDHYDRKLQAIIGTKGKPIYDVQRGKVMKPGIPTLRAMATVLFQPLDLLIRATEGERVQPVPVDLTAEMVARADQIPARAGDGEAVSIMRMDLSYAMGPGTNLDDSYVESEPVIFDLNFLRGLTRADPSQLRIVDGIGDSMFPTILDRELLIIDVSQRMLNMQDRIWAISLYGAGALKRLRTISKDRVLVISDNPDVADQEVSAEDITIAGRLVGSIKRH